MSDEAMTTDELRRIAKECGRASESDDCGSHARGFYSGVASNMENYTIPIAEERDRLARILAVERGDESQAPEGWAMTDPGSWRARSQTYRIVCRTHAIGERGQLLRAWEAWVAGKRVGVYPFALEAMEAANAAREKQ